MMRRLKASCFSRFVLYRLLTFLTTRIIGFLPFYLCGLEAANPLEYSH